jgi:hypothetical protein
MVAVTLVVACSSSPTAPPTETTSSAGSPFNPASVLPPTGAPPTASATDVRSKLANISLPAGSAEDDPTRFPEMELWRVPTSYDSTINHLRSQLPINADYEGLAWCTQAVNTKLGLTTWSWGDANELLVISVNDDATVTITRGPEEGDDRADCDVPAPGNTPYSELAAIPLPAGTVRSEVFTQSPTMESWGFPGTYEFAVQYWRVPAE